jgi:hypothetical protein
MYAERLQSKQNCCLSNGKVYLTNKIQVLSYLVFFYKRELNCKMSLWLINVYFLGTNKFVPVDDIL